ncbi:hypothetical protein E2C01_029092 [Portunus trituberculatus]|uniref:Uncharacterized protein n=1 Tax=Portunus trituberculatus TaxID=210409 RepID=A0A5B7ETR0_PORTR|nr:hypothetical protein [Portunus trituberculatus]
MRKEHAYPDTRLLGLLRPASIHSPEVSEWAAVTHWRGGQGDTRLATVDTEQTQLKEWALCGVNSEWQNAVKYAIIMRRKVSGWRCRLGGISTPKGSNWESKPRRPESRQGAEK